MASEHTTSTFEVLRSFVSTLPHPQLQQRILDMNARLASHSWIYQSSGLPFSAKSAYPPTATFAQYSSCRGFRSELTS